MKQGTAESKLVYLRSSDGGSTFEEPKVLYSVPQNMTELRVKGSGAYLTIASVHNCWYCAEVNIIHFFTSDDNGISFNDRKVQGNFNSYAFLTWDVATEGPHIYFLVLEPVSGNYDYNLHLFSSGDRGLNFEDHIISVPSQNGLHHPFNLMDYGWGYARKMATEGEKIWVIWSGLNAANQERIFVSGSQDGGHSFSIAQEISGNLEGFQRGQETIMINGNEIYATFLKADSRIFVAKSHNDGALFDPAYEFTLPNDPQLRSGWGPILIKDPANHNVFLVRNGPVFGLLTPGSDYPVQSFIGNANIKRQNFAVAMLDPDGMLHIAFVGGGVWLSTGVFTDDEIFYRRVDPDFKPILTEDYALQLKAKENPGDGTGF
ncbi:MAG TPA: hypothetical protein VJ508_15425, partial [Saprospiraceae bacterium]|nr:hypothetical protein [Saprospiraceae bacterium]